MSLSPSFSCPPETVVSRAVDTRPTFHIRSLLESAIGRKGLDTRSLLLILMPLSLGTDSFAYFSAGCMGRRCPHPASGDILNVLFSSKTSPFSGRVISCFSCRRCLQIRADTCLNNNRSCRWEGWRSCEDEGENGDVVFTRSGRAVDEWGGGPAVPLDDACMRSALHAVSHASSLRPIPLFVSQ